MKPDDEFYDIFTNALDDVAADKLQQSNSRNQSTSYSKNINEKRPLSALQPRKNPGNLLNIKAGILAKKNQRKELTNIDDDAYQRIKHALDVFSKAHQNVLFIVRGNNWFQLEKYGWCWKKSLYHQRKLL